MLRTPPDLVACSRRSLLLRGLAPVLLISAAALPSLAGASQVRRSRYLLGTQVELSAEGRGQGLVEEAVDEAFAEMARLSAMMSRFEPDSLVSQLNRMAGLGRSLAVPPELLEVLENGHSVYLRTHGLFDMTVGSMASWHFEAGQVGRVPDPVLLRSEQGLIDGAGLTLDPRRKTARLARPGMALDLGGIAKLPILAAGMKKLREFGVTDALVNGGGDVLYSGRTQGRPWRVGLRDPRSPGRVMAVASLEGRGVLAASGDYERCFFESGQRQHHILDPRTGRPSRGPRGVFLFAKDVESVNGLGVPLMIGGSDYAKELLPSSSGTQALIVESSGGMTGIAAPDLAWRS